MIRYVVAVVLTTALLGIGFAAVQEVSVVRGEMQVDGELTRIDNAAVSLMEHDEPAPDAESPPRRVVEVDFPAGGFASASVETLVFEPVPETDRTVVRYQFDDGSVNTARLDAPLVNAAPGTDTVDLSNSAGSRTVVLELALDENREPVIQVAVR